MSQIKFVGGPLDARTAEPPTPVAEGDKVAVRVGERFAAYQRAGDLMLFLELVDSVEIHAGTGFGRVRVSPPQS